MNVRIKFAKYGSAKFIGHLDVVRYFQKAIRRAGLEVSYSGGFNPHQLLYFAAPLSLGETSDGEYMDMELAGDYPLEELAERLNGAMAEGFAVRAAAEFPVWKPNEKKKSIMSSTTCADYMVSVKDVEVEREGVRKPYSEWLCGLSEKMEEFLGEPEIPAEKISKKSGRVIDLKPLVYAWGTTAEALRFPAVSGKLPACAEASAYPDAFSAGEGTVHAERYENGLRLFFKLAGGSADNLKPGLLMETFCKKFGLPFEENALQLHRMETYGDGMAEATEQGRVFVPLLCLNTSHVCNRI